MESDGKGKLAAIRMWELETINSLGWTEERWVLLSLEERYRKVSAHKLNDWMSSLETRDEIRRMRAKSGAKI